MITKTLNLDNEYQELFNEVLDVSTAKHELDSDSPIINVDNIEAYFGSIQEIAELDSKFLRLPLDEPLFEIDANSRKITVPNEFKSNGLSVQGDHLAEIIFFRIERYFDYKDLSTCNIEVNWKMGDKEGKTKRFIQFNDVMTIDEVKSNCIIFGWPINNIVTAKSGSLTFAVEFNQTETVDGEQKVTYRFNTLPTTINIKDGLILGENPDVYRLDDDIIRTLVNSSYGEGDAAVGDLVWVTGNGHGIIPGVMVNGEVVLGDFVSSINLPTAIVNGEPNSAPIDFYAIANIDSGTRIQYTDEINNTLIPEYLLVKRPLVEVTDLSNLDANTIYYADAAGLNRITPAEVAAAAETEYPVESVWQMASLDENLDYLVKVEEEGVESYQPASAEDLAKWGKITVIESENEEEPDQEVLSVDLYIKAAKITASTDGSYFIKAQGYKVDANEVKIGSGEVETSDVVVIPAVEQPAGVLIAVQPDYFGDGVQIPEGYSFDRAESNNVVFLDGEAEGRITAAADVHNPGALKFVWQKENEENEFENINEENEFSILNSSTLTVNEAGKYQVVVTNFQNSKFSDPVTSAEIIASPLAGKITQVQASYQLGSTTNLVPASGIGYNSNANNQFNRSISLFIDPANVVIDGPVGTLEYSWYQPIYDDDMNIVGKELMNNSNLDPSKITFNGGDYDIIPEIRNNYNGSIYTFDLDVIKVQDSAR